MTPTPPAHSGEWTDAQIARFWSRPSGDRWVPFVVLLATVVTIAMVGLLADAAWARAAFLERPTAQREIGAVIGGVAGVGLLATTWIWRYRDISPWACAAVALVCVHIAIAFGAWWLSYRLQPEGYDLPLLRTLPAPTIALAASVLLFAAAYVHSRIRRLTRAPGWLRGAVVFALAFLLLFGIWLPIAIPKETLTHWYHPALEARRLMAQLLVPPAAVALVIAAITILRPRWLTVLWPAAVALVIGFTIGAMAARDDVPLPAMVIYSNYVHVLFAAAWFALATLAALAWTHARVLRANRADTSRPAPWVQRGTVEAPASEHVVGTWHVDGWLAGLRTSLGGFTLRTERGDALRVPDGARLVAPVPASTAAASRDEHIPALRAGDEVIVSGFVAPPADGPYRAGGAPVPGSDGLIVTARRRRDDTIGRDVVLVLYRPCILFLIFAALAALPGVVGNPAPETTSQYTHDHY